MAGIQDALLQRETPPVLRPSTLTRETVIAHFGDVMGESIWLDVQGKAFGAAETDALNARLAATWHSMRARIAAVTIGARAQRDLLAAAGAPVDPMTLGWSDALFGRALGHAREIRNRYTFLDLRADTQA
jgi:glycerol-1-phosphate dehydrogenase [NAD(P)+]